MPRLPSWGRRLAWAGVAIVAVVLSLQLDPWVSDVFSQMTWPWLRQPAQWITHSAEGQWAFIASLIFWAVAVIWRRQDWKRVALIVLIASTLAGISATTVRGMAGRTRPTNRTEQGWFGPYHNGQVLVGKHAYNSFPSGHTATAAGFAFALLLAGSRAGWFFVGWALLVACSRIYLNCHHFSDTLASAIVGLVCAVWVCRWVDRKKMPDKSSGSTPTASSLSPELTVSPKSA